jgi:adenylate kinase family enzyme
MIIYITGVIGSGKSSLGDRLEQESRGLIKHFDIDRIYMDIVKGTIGTIESHILDPNIGEEGAERFLRSQYSQVKDELIRLDKDKYQILIFTSHLDGLYPADKAYFIELKDIEMAYRRVLKREINRIVDKKDQIEKIIDESKNVETIQFCLRECLDILFCDNKINSFDTYKRIYEDTKRDAIEANIEIKTPEEIYRKIMSLLSSPSKTGGKGKRIQQKPRKLTKKIVSNPNNKSSKRVQAKKEKKTRVKK